MIAFRSGVGVSLFPDLGLGLRVDLVVDLVVEPVDLGWVGKHVWTIGPPCVWFLS
jgi:hypothetical protein